MARSPQPSVPNSLARSGARRGIRVNSRLKAAAAPRAIKSLLPLALIGILWAYGWADDFTIEIFYTRDIYGHTELCGCSPALRGGLPRTRSLFDKLLAGRKLVLRLDCGNFLPKKEDPLLPVRFEQAIAGYAELAYDAVNLGARDIELGLEQLARLERSGIPVVSSNVLKAGGARLFPPYRVVEIEGLRIAIIGAAAIDSNRGELDGLEILAPEVALGRAMPELKRESPDLVILLGDFSARQALDIGSKIEGIDLIVSAADISFTPRSGPRIAGWSGDYGEHMGHALFSRSGGSSQLKYQMVPIGAELGEDARMVALLDRAREHATSRIAVSPTLDQQLAGYAGSASCQVCHASAYSIWRESRHSHSYETLEKRGVAGRWDCLACHVTGYDYRTGRYHAREVGCESCHGPGLAHIEFFASGRSGPRPSMRAGSQSCLKCHVKTNSPLFTFDYYWEKIKH